MGCAYGCHQIGGPWIAENPDCPIHGQEGLGDKMEEMQSVIRRLIEELENHTGGAHGMDLSSSAQALISEAQSFL